MGVRLLSCLLVAGALSAQTQFFPLKELRPGMKGVGKTVFSGGKIEDFQVEILGVLNNSGPKQNVVLARLSGGPLAETGVMQGMSGSPVYIDGRLLGAVALGFQFSKEPIAGIRPIEEMLSVAEPAPPKTVRLRPMPWDAEVSLGRNLPPREDVLAGGGRMLEIATPVSFSGFTRGTIEHFGAQLEALGLEPRQGMAGGGVSEPQMGDPSQLRPGAMISVQLLSGDMTVGADGTVTYIDGRRIYAFGHRFMAVGPAEMPFARSEVLALLPNLSSSFKISSSRELLGTITADRSTAIAGELGRRAATMPLAISVRRRDSSAAPVTYRMRMVNDRVLSPFLVQMAVFSAIDATERTLGESTFSLRGEVQFENGAAPVKLDNLYAGDMNLPVLVSTGASAPLAYIMQSGFETLRPKAVTIEIESSPRKRQLQIDQVLASRKEVRPGDSVELTVVLTGENGFETTRKVTYRVPVGAPPGPLQFTAADANTINLTEYRQMLMSTPKNAAQLLAFMNGLRANDKAYVRVWRAEPSYDIEGDNLPDPPASVAMVLSRQQPAPGLLTPANSKVAEFEISAGDLVVSGSKTIQVEVKE
jgi:hypothetical protein